MARHVLARGVSGWAGFGLGVATCVLLDLAGPHLAKAAAPAARSALKFMFAVTDQIGRSAARLRERAEDFVADARAEYDAEQEAASGAQKQPPVAEA